MCVCYDINNGILLGDILIMIFLENKVVNMNLDFVLCLIGLRVLLIVLIKRVIIFCWI